MSYFRPMESGKLTTYNIHGGGDVYHLAGTEIVFYMILLQSEAYIKYKRMFECQLCKKIRSIPLLLARLTSK